MNKQVKELEITIDNNFKYYVYTPNHLKENMPLLLFFTWNRRNRY